MTDLRKLRVSLTKHGAHKIAILLRKYDKDEVLDHLAGSEPGVNIELAQAKKNLSYTNGVVPAVWNEARAKGGPTVDALVLVAIILSHNDLIDALKKSNNRTGFAGTIERSNLTNEKAYTNLAHTIDELGYGIEHVYDHVRYDFDKLFKIPDLFVLFNKVLRLKLCAAGWDQSNSIIKEATKLGIHKVFSLSKMQFSSWLKTGFLASDEASLMEAKDARFFSDANDYQPVGKFVFRPGHTPKRTGVITTKMSRKEMKATLLHNDIQNELYNKLAAEYGKSCVGTEVPSGDGTSIDLVVKTNSYCCFYEIKTNPSVRVCIRQAIPQLLEYAYWQGNDTRADKLIIVSPKKLTPQAAKYLEFLRARFKLNVHYEEFKR